MPNIFLKREAILLLFLLSTYFHAMSQIDLRSLKKETIYFSDLPEEVRGNLPNYVKMGGENGWDLGFHNLDSSCITAKYFMKSGGFDYYKGAHFLIGKDEFFLLTNPPKPYILFDKKLYYPKEYNIHFIISFPKVKPLGDFTFEVIDLSKYLNY